MPSLESKIRKLEADVQKLKSFSSSPVRAHRTQDKATGLPELVIGDITTKDVKIGEPTYIIDKDDGNLYIVVNTGSEIKKFKSV